MNACLLLLAALQAPLDEGTFVVREDTAEVARESFRLNHGRLARGGIGWTLATTIRYDRSRPVVVLSPILDVTTDTLPATLQYNVADPRQPMRILGELGRGRFTVRFVARATERAREFPAGGRPVVLDDSVFALYLFAAWRAGGQPSQLTAIVPRGLRRDAIEIQDQGLSATTVNHVPVTLRHITVTGGPNLVVHLWIDANGRLMKVAIPSRRLSAERTPGG
jgi:hypothetical protein